MDKQKTIQVEDVTIEQHINTHYRDYSYYILSSRGIPSKYDGLIPVQRLLLLHAPENLKGTNVLIGDIFGSELYHHGDQSLAGAISRMCRIHDNSMSLLKGDGFFGNSMKGSAAPRYTKVRSNPEVSEMLKKYISINEYDVEGNCKFVNLDVPIGLCTSILGIAIAYRSQILPRKYEDMKSYLDGNKNVSLKPYFMGFKGKISRNPKNPNAWMISSSITYDEVLKVIKIVDLPPMLRYDTFLDNSDNKKEKKKKTMSSIIEDYPHPLKFINNSKEHVDMSIRIRKGSKGEIDSLIAEITKIASISVSEDIIFADEDGIVRYDSIRDYLDDFKIFRNRSVHKKMVWDKEELIYEMVFNSIKAKFVDYMGSNKRNNEDVKSFITKAVDHYMDKLQERHTGKISDRIKAIPAYKITTEEMKQSIDNFADMKKKLKILSISIEEFKENNHFEIDESKSKSLAKTT